MIWVGEHTIKSLNVGNNNISKVFVGNKVVWPTDNDYKYQLRNLSVYYSDDTTNIHPNCNNYVYITAILVRKLGDTVISDNQSVTLTPMYYNTSTPKVNGEELYVISNDDVNIGKPIIKANENLKETEYKDFEEYSVEFSGTFKIGDKTIGTNDSDWIYGGIEHNPVKLLANKKTIFTEKKETTGVTLSQFTDYVPSSGDSISIPDCERIYTLTTQKTVWTSGVERGGDIYPNQSEEIIPYSISITPTSSGATLSNDGRSITVTQNESNVERNWSVQGIYYDNTSIDPFYSNIVTLTQRANSYAYSEITNIEVNYPIIPANGGDVTPSVSFTQTYGWSPNTSGAGTVPVSDATITYYIADDIIYYPTTPTDQGTVSASSMGTDPYPDMDNQGHGKIVKYVKVKIESHNNNGTSGNIPVYQAPNVITSTSSEVSIKINGVEKTSFDVGPQEETYSYGLSAIRTNTWSSRESSTQTITSDNLTIEKSGCVNSATYSGFTVSENIDNEPKTGSITVKDNTYGSKTLTINQSAVVYEFRKYSEENPTIDWQTETFTIAFYSSINGHWQDINPSENISYDNHGFVFSGQPMITKTGIPNLYSAAFNCSQNTSSTDKYVDITFTQPNSNNSITYRVTQSAKPTTTIDTNGVDVIVLNKNGGSSNTFKLKSNYAWQIDTNFAYCDFDNSNRGIDSNLISVSQTSGTASDNYTNITVSRKGMLLDDYVIDIKITSDNLIKHVIVVPPLTLTSNINNNNWSPNYQSSTYTNAIETNYPTSCISWSSNRDWLSGNGYDITVGKNDGNSERTGTITVDAEINKVYFQNLPDDPGMGYNKSDSLTFNVTQGYNSTTTVYVCCQKSEPDVMWLSPNTTAPNTSWSSRIAAPKQLRITDVDVTDSQGRQEYEGVCLIEQGNDSAAISWYAYGTDDEINYEDIGGIGTIIKPGFISWGSAGDDQAPSGYTLGSTDVYWFD